jgi:hypothetical protein
MDAPGNDRPPDTTAIEQNRQRPVLNLVRAVQMHTNGDPE